MEFSRLVRRRRMTRRYDPGGTLPRAVLDTLLDTAIRAPSAGFSQGWDFVVLTDVVDRQGFWDAATGPDHAADDWLSGLREAPALVVCVADRRRYLDRYAEPDKGWTDRDPDRWPIPYWDVDTGMAALLLHLAAIDAGYGSCFFGVPAPRHGAVRAALGLPLDRRLVGVVSIGVARPGPLSPSLLRGRRSVPEVAHDGRFGVPWAVASPVGRETSAAGDRENGAAP